MSTEVRDVAADDDTMTDEERRIAGEMGDPSPEDDVDQSAGEGGRRSLSELADEEPEAEDETPQYTLFGTAPAVNTKVQGARVSSSHVKFKAKQQDLPGQFQMGDVVFLAVKARVDKLEFSSSHDADGNVTSTKRTHTVSALKVEQMGHVDDKFAEVDGRASALLKSLTAALEAQGVASAADVAFAAIESAAASQEQEG
jgi:hypothetical protein